MSSGIETIKAFEVCNLPISEYAIFYLLTLIFIFWTSQKWKHDKILLATLAVTTVCTGIISYKKASNETVDIVLLIILFFYTIFILYSMFFRRRVKSLKLNKINLVKEVKIA